MARVTRDQLLIQQALAPSQNCNDQFLRCIRQPDTMASGKLYRVLRDDENPAHGIVAKDDGASISPSEHILNGSRRASQWIYLSRSLEVLKHIYLKNKKKRDRRKEIVSSYIRIVEKDEWKLRMYSDRKAGPRVSLENEAIKTGRILDFTDISVKEEYLSNNIIPWLTSYSEERRLVEKFKEVLVERFIPADCCRMIMCTVIPAKATHV